MRTGARSSPQREAQPLGHEHASGSAGTDAIRSMFAEPTTHTAGALQSPVAALAGAAAGCGGGGGGGCVGEAKQTTAPATAPVIIASDKDREREKPPVHREQVACELLVSIALACLTGGRSTTWARAQSGVTQIATQIASGISRSPFVPDPTPVDLSKSETKTAAAAAPPPMAAALNMAFGDEKRRKKMRVFFRKKDLFFFSLTIRSFAIPWVFNLSYEF